MTTQMEQLLEGILDRTNRNRITWHTTVNSQAFLTVLGSQSVVIAKRTGGLSEPQYKLEVRDGGGSTIASLLSGEYSKSQQTPVQSTERLQLMEQLFELARKSAVNDGLREVIGRLDKLIEDLEKV